MQPKFRLRELQICSSVWPKMLYNKACGALITLKSIEKFRVISDFLFW